jgi:hypothetical protein
VIGFKLDPCLIHHPSNEGVVADLAVLRRRAPCFQVGFVDFFREKSSFYFFEIFCGFFETNHTFITKNLNLIALFLIIYLQPKDDFEI